MGAVTGFDRGASASGNDAQKKEESGAVSPHAVLTGTGKIVKIKGTKQCEQDF